MIPLAESAQQFSSAVSPLLRYCPQLPGTNDSSRMAGNLLDEIPSWMAAGAPHSLRSLNLAGNRIASVSVQVRLTHCLTPLQHAPALLSARDTFISPCLPPAIGIP